MSGDPTPAFGKHCGITVLASRAYLCAAAYRIPGRIGPFDGAAVAHALSMRPGIRRSKNRVCRLRPASMMGRSRWNAVQRRADRTLHASERLWPGADRALHASERLWPRADRALHAPERLRPRTDRALHAPARLWPRADWALHAPARLWPRADRALRASDRDLPRAGARSASVRALLARGGSPSARIRAPSALGQRLLCSDQGTARPGTGVRLHASARHLPPRARRAVRVGAGRSRRPAASCCVGMPGLRGPVYCAATKEVSHDRWSDWLGLDRP